MSVLVLAGSLALLPLGCCRSLGLGPVRDSLDNAATRYEKLKQAREELAAAVEQAATFELGARGARRADGEALDAVALSLRQGNDALGSLALTLQACVDTSKEELPTSAVKGDDLPDDAQCFRRLLSTAVKAEIATHARAANDLQAAHAALHK